MASSQAAGVPTTTMIATAASVVRSDSHSASIALGSSSDASSSRRPDVDEDRHHRQHEERQHERPAHAQQERRNQAHAPGGGRKPAALRAPRGPLPPSSPSTNCCACSGCFAPLTTATPYATCGLRSAGGRSPSACPRWPRRRSRRRSRRRPRPGRPCRPRPRRRARWSARWRGSPALVGRQPVEHLARVGADRHGLRAHRDRRPRLGRGPRGPSRRCRPAPRAPAGWPAKTTGFSTSPSSYSSSAASCWPRRTRPAYALADLGCEIVRARERERTLAASKSCPYA